MKNHISLTTLFFQVLNYWCFYMNKRNNRHQRLKEKMKPETKISLSIISNFLFESPNFVGYQTFHKIIYPIRVFPPYTPNTACLARLHNKRIRIRFSSFLHNSLKWIDLSNIQNNNLVFDSIQLPHPQPEKCDWVSCFQNTILFFFENFFYLKNWLQNDESKKFNCYPPFEKLKTVTSNFMLTFTK